MGRLPKSVGAIAAVFGFAVCISSVAAHHSATMFDHAKTLVITGSVVELRWVNPHVSLSINGVLKEGDEPALWVMEMTSPGNLVRAGGWAQGCREAWR